MEAKIQALHTERMTHGFLIHLPNGQTNMLTHMPKMKNTGPRGSKHIISACCTDWLRNMVDKGKITSYSGEERGLRSLWNGQTVEHWHWQPYPIPRDLTIGDFGQSTAIQWVLTKKTSTNSKVFLMSICHRWAVSASHPQNVEIET